MFTKLTKFIIKTAKRSCGCHSTAAIRKEYHDFI